MSINFKKGDIVVLKPNSLCFCRRFVDENGHETYDEVMYGQRPMKVSRIDHYSSQESYLLLHTTFEHDLLVPLHLIEKCIGNVHNWFARCENCNCLSKGGIICWKCSKFVEPNCITWTGMEVYPRFLQRGGIDPVTYVDDDNHPDRYPVGSFYIDVDLFSRTEYEDLDWLKRHNWQPQYLNYWLQEIALVLVSIGAYKISCSMIQRMNVGISCFEHIRHFPNFTTNASDRYAEDEDEITVAMSCSSDDNVQNFYRHEHLNTESRYAYLEHGPNSMDDWYKEIGWILAAHGATEMTKEIVKRLNDVIEHSSGIRH